MGFVHVTLDFKSLIEKCKLGHYGPNKLRAKRDWHCLSRPYANRFLKECPYEPLYKILTKILSTFDDVMNVA